MEVPSEETVGHMRERYMAINLHARSYTIKALLPKVGGAACTCAVWLYMHSVCAGCCASAAGAVAWQHVQWRTEEQMLMLYRASIRVLSYCH